MNAPLPCGSCGSSSEHVIFWFVARNGLKMLREECGACSAYVKFAKQDAENIVRALPDPDGLDPAENPWKREGDCVVRRHGEEFIAAPMQMLADEKDWTTIIVDAARVPWTSLRDLAYLTRLSLHLRRKTT